MSEYERYIDVCSKAVSDDDVFNNFKRHDDYRLILEHCSAEHGRGYLDVIIRDNPVLLNSMSLFMENDTIGDPQQYFYDKIGILISPTTLRYIKVLSDLMLKFGSLHGFNIIEVGVGYGGQCKIISDIFNFSSYTLIDLDEVLLLSAKYLDTHRVRNLTFLPIEKVRIQKSDLFISNYAFTEFGKEHQILYRDNLIALAQRGYMTCNQMGQRDDIYTKDDILSFKESGEVLEEEPLTDSHNFIYIWH